MILYKDIKGRLTLAFKYAKQFADIPEDASLELLYLKSGYRLDYEAEMQDVKDEVKDYKPIRHALLPVMNEINEDIRRHNREIQRRQNGGQNFSDNLKV